MDNSLSPDQRRLFSDSINKTKGNTGNVVKQFQLRPAAYKLTCHSEPIPKIAIYKGHGQLQVTTDNLYVTTVTDVGFLHVL